MTDKTNVKATDNVDNVTKINASMEYRSGYSGELIKMLINLIESDFKIKINIKSTKGSISRQLYEKKIASPIKEIDENADINIK